jgi:hypothetical protein
MTSLRNTQNLSAFNGAGAVSAADPVTGLVTLTATDDFYFPIPWSVDGESLAIQIQTTALIAGTFTVEACNFPAARGPGGAADVTDWNETAGGIWTPVNVAALGVAQTVGTGWTATVLSLAKTAGAGVAMIYLFSAAAARYRVKAAITTTGTCRVAVHGKD